MSYVYRVLRPDSLETMAPYNFITYLLTYFISFIVLTYYV